MDLLPRFIGILMVFVIYSTLSVKGAAYGETCADDSECPDTTHICGTEAPKTCICGNSYFRNTDNTACAAKVGLDGNCDIAELATDQCSEANTECKDNSAGVNKCLCKTTHYSDGTACQTKIVLNSGCTSGDPASYCADSLAECRTDGAFKCLCLANYFENKAGTCAAQVGLDGTCDSTDSATDQCSVTNTDCDSTDNKCLCKATYYSDGSACVLQKTALNEACDATESASDQCAVTDSECRLDGSTGKCLCKATYYVDGAGCTIRKSPDFACSATGQCVTNAECDTADTNTCVCNAGYIATPTTSPTRCNGVVKFETLSYIYVVSIFVSMMFILR